MQEQQVGFIVRMRDDIMRRHRGPHVRQLDFRQPDPQVAGAEELAGGEAHR